MRPARFWLHRRRVLILELSCLSSGYRGQKGERGQPGVGLPGDPGHMGPPGKSRRCMKKVLGHSVPTGTIIVSQEFFIQLFLNSQLFICNQWSTSLWRYSGTPGSTYESVVHPSLFTAEPCPDIWKTAGKVLLQTPLWWTKCNNVLFRVPFQMKNVNSPRNLPTLTWLFKHLNILNLQI